MDQATCPMPGFTEIHQARFYGRVMLPNDGGCMLWTGTEMGNGYGNFWDGARTSPAHRVAWILAYGEPPGGELIELDHLCRVRNCVNPDHVEWVTHAENSRRALIRDETCKQGHRWDEQTPIVKPGGLRTCRVCQQEREATYRAQHRAANPPQGVQNRAVGERCGSAKLTEADVVAIRASTDTHRRIGAAYGISNGTVSRIRSRAIWKHVA